MKATENKSLYDKIERGTNQRENGSVQRASFLDTVNSVALFIFSIYNALTISWNSTHNRARLQINCALGGSDDSPQHRALAYSYRQVPGFF